ncbi:MAG: hypothetical protein HQ521_08370 [Bacteroidetes bacterium]|nr:hypothetical protein [Bacteroidota bacterium]
MISIANKIQSIIACPVCKNHIKQNEDIYHCENCMINYFNVDSKPYLIIDKDINELSAKHRSNNALYKERIKNIIPTPDIRLWSKKSKILIKRILNDIQPDSDDTVTLNIGSGSERILTRIFKNYIK